MRCSMEGPIEPDGEQQQPEDDQWPSRMIGHETIIRRRARSSVSVRTGLLWKTQPSQLGAIREAATSPLAIASATGEGLDIIGQH
jgi:hypothetical protein